MTTLHSRRERVLAEAVVSNYLNELSTRERPAERPERERAVTRIVHLRRARSRQRPALVTA